MDGPKSSTARLSLRRIYALLAFMAMALLVFAASAQAAEQTVEAESFTKPNGTAVVSDQMYSGGKALKITSGQAVATKQVTISETSTLVVRARAGQSGGSPTLTIRVDGENVATRKITSSTLADYPYPAVELEPGTYTIGLKGGNLAQGRYVFVDVLTFAPTVDTTPPEIEITQGPAEGSVINQDSVTIAWTSNIDDPDYRCDFRKQTPIGVPVVWIDNNVPCSSPRNYTGLEDGDYNFEIKALDSSGNTIAIDGVGFTVATTP
jgi:hypothetical protein